MDDGWMGLGWDGDAWMKSVDGMSPSVRQKWSASASASWAKRETIINDRFPATEYRSA